MPKHIRPDDSPGLTGRILGALMAFVFSGLSVIYLPLLLFWKFPIYFGFSLGPPSIFFFPVLCMWGLVVAFSSLAIGFQAGVYETMEIFNVMWQTGESFDPEVHKKVILLKKITAVSAVVTMALLCLV